MIIAKYDVQGRYLSVGAKTIVPPGVSAPHTEFEDSKVFGIYDGIVNLQTQYHDTALNGPVDMPPQPSEYHVFDYASKQWAPDRAKAQEAMLYQRMKLLTASDWVTTRAVETGTPASAEWLAYRQALRDITLQADPWAIVWPVMPSN